MQVKIHMPGCCRLLTRRSMVVVRRFAEDNDFAKLPEKHGEILGQVVELLQERCNREAYPSIQQVAALATFASEMGTILQIDLPQGDVIRFVPEE